MNWIIEFVIGAAFLGVINYRAQADAKTINDGVWINHKSSAFWAVMAAIILNNIAWFATWKPVIIVPFLLSVYWLGFDLQLNIYRKLPFWYIPIPKGKGRDAITDRILWALPYRYISQYILKGLAIFITYKIINILCTTQI